MSTVSLVGMPAAGKSTIGILLAKHLGLDYIDTDVLIQVRTGRNLEDIVTTEGVGQLRAVEAETLLCLTAQDAVISTGGSVVYSDSAMQHLLSLGEVIYLQVPLSTLQQRLPTLKGRGIAATPDTTLEQLASERVPLYERYASITVNADLATPEAVVAVIAEAIGR